MLENGNLSFENDEELKLKFVLNIQLYLLRDLMMNHPMD